MTTQLPPSSPHNQPQRNQPPESIEWPTWLLIATIYGGWAATVLAYRQMPPWLGQTLLVLLSAWHLSLQHELLHRRQVLLLLLPPLAANRSTLLQLCRRKPV